MTFFREAPEPRTDTDEEHAWLLAELERLREEKALPEGITWDVRHGQRETGPPGGRRLVKAGFLLHARLTEAAAPLPLTCFVPRDDLVDAEGRASASLVLSLWLDRLLTARE